MGNLLKKILLATVLAALMIGIVGCENKTEDATESSADIPQEETSADTAGKVLVVYFSATGTTKAVAETIAEVTDADIYEIVPKEPYTDADLDYDDPNTRATKEQNDPDIRPEFEDLNLKIDDSYSAIFIGYPIWWGEEPRIMDTFVESYNFDGITVIPFCTSGSSEISKSRNNLTEKAGTGEWLVGKRFSRDASLDEIKDWVDGLGLK